MSRSPSLLLVIAFIISSLSNVNAFFGGIGKATIPKGKVSPAILEEALEIYTKRFPEKDARKKFFFETWGVPERDLDGTLISSAKTNSSAQKSKSLFDIDVTRQKNAFSELARLYGEDDALTMTKILPNILAFDFKNFDGSLSAFSELFGEEEAKGMVIRNPSLLAVNPTVAASSDDQTMQLSYVVSATRGKPIGQVLIALLCIPGLEQVTQIPIRAQLFASITGSNTAEVADAIQKFSASLPLMN